MPPLQLAMDSRPRLPNPSAVRPPVETTTLAVHDLVALDAASRVARIHNKLGVVDDLLVVVVGVVCNDKHAVVLAKILQRRALHLQIVLPAAADEWEVRIVIA